MTLSEHPGDHHSSLSSLFDLFVGSKNRESPLWITPVDYDLSSAWMVRDAELALKSPTRITASPGNAR